MDKTLAGEVIGEIEDFYVTSGIVQLTAPSQVDAVLKQMIGGMTQRVPEQETQGSGWVFQRVSTLEVHLAKYQPLKGSSYLKMPKPLALKKAIVSVKNSDDQCFKWAILSALFPAKKDAQRVGKYAEHEDKMDWSGLTFPVALDKIPLFEKRNRVSVNVYGCDVNEAEGRAHSCQPFLLQKSKFGAEAQTWRHVDLLLLESGAKQVSTSHYCWTKSFSRFARQPSDYGHQKKHFCHYCPRVPERSEAHGAPEMRMPGDHRGATRPAEA